MSTLVALVLGGGVGLGVTLLVFGALGRTVLPSLTRSGRRPERLLLAVVVGVVAAIAVYGVTGWVVGGLLAGLGGLVAPRALSSRTDFRAEIDKVEAIASWAEMLRDTIAAAAGLEQAIGATGPIAPKSIASEVSRLAARLEFEPLPDALRRFADEVNHPTCDFVIAGLVIAAEKEAREIGALLSQLAETARDEAKMRTRVWIDRARTRTSVRVIALCVVLFAAGLLALNRSYLQPYDDVKGQLMLLVIGGIFAGSFVAMDRMGRIELPDRFIARRAPR